jgi:hypothetical protein
MARSKEGDAVSLSRLKAGGFLASESKRLETVKDVQKQLLDTFEQFNREQIARAQQEINLASELSAKVASARSVPDVMNAYQSWISKRMALFVEDGQRIVNATMKLLSIGKAET